MGVCPRSRSQRVAVTTLSALLFICCFYLYLYYSPFESTPYSQFFPPSRNILGRKKLDGYSKKSSADEKTLRASTPTTTFAERRQHYIDACASTPAVANFRRSWHNKASLLQTGRLAYCNIGKVGSTTLKKIVYYLNQHYTGSFFNESHKYGDIHTNSHAVAAQELQGKDVTSVVFVREPYSRLFSGYMSKIFMPDVVRWRIYAGPVIEILYNVSRDDLCSAARVTFREFVRYFLETEGGRGRRDTHFVPMSQQCGFCTGVPELDQDNYRSYSTLKAAPQKKKSKSKEDGRESAGLQRDCSPGDGGKERCDNSVADPQGPGAWRSGFVYDVIGKLEHLADDFDAVLDLTGLRDRLPTDFDLRHGNVREEVTRSASTHFQNVAKSSAKVLSCMSREEALRRMWVRQQARGRISVTEAFPAEVLARSHRQKQEAGKGSQREKEEDKEEEDYDEEDKARFVALTLSAFDRSHKDPGALRMNRKLLMAEAYSSVPLKDRRKLQSIFQRDFQLFDYPSTIPEVFPEDDEFPSPGYGFFDRFQDGPN